MAISRMQQPRQMYGLGSLVKSVTKGVKKAVSGVKDFVKSDAGKALGIAALGFGVPGTSFGGLFGRSAGSMFGGAKGFLGGYGFTPSMQNLAANIGLGSFENVGGNRIFQASKLGKFLGDNKALLGTAAIGGLTGYLAQQGMEEEEIESIKRNPTALRGYLADYYSKLNPSANPREVDAFVETNMSEYSTSFATGGRAGFANGNEARTLTYEEAKAMNPSMFMDTTTSAYGDAGEGRPVPEFLKEQKSLKENLQFLDKIKGGVSPRTTTYMFKEYLDNALETGKISEEQYQRMLMPFFGAGGEKITQEIEAYDRDERAYGGRMQYAFGTPEGNAIQASGIEGIPLNINPAGATELDMRETGGFVPPVGVKEKADDIPAMLSNNEFVMTAKAVKEFGDGDVNKGADRMYAMMKTLENGGRV